MLKTDRNLLVLLLLSAVTLGIYSLVFLHGVIKDVNQVCEGHGEETPRLLKVVLLSIVTLGIYGIVWTWKLCNRTKSYCEINYAASGLMLDSCVSGGAWFGWNFIPLAGPLIASGKQLRNINNICKIYNKKMGSTLETAAMGGENDSLES